MGESRVGETDLIIAGDFNLNTPDLQEALNFTQGTTASGSTLNSSGSITSNVYDHILVDDLSATLEMVDSPQIVDATSFVADGVGFYSKVSDHLPVVARFRTFGPDDD